MIRIATRSKRRVPTWHKTFLTMLPAIRRHARICFRHLGPDAREDAIHEVVCNACVAIARLAELGKLDLAYATVLAKFGVAQVRDGRRVGCTLNCQDVLSSYCQRLKHLTVQRLDRYDPEEDAWQEIVVEDRTAGPADIAATRLDFTAWLRSLPRRDCRIAENLALGNRTTDVAKKFKVSQGRVSQLRHELAESWSQFVGGEPAKAA